MGVLLDQSRVDSILSDAELGEDMVSSGEDLFTKQPACPSSRVLLDFRLNRLAAELTTLVKWHLEACDFCWAEVQMLGHHHINSRGEGRPPTMPVNLRVLAEALLRNKTLPRQGQDDQSARAGFTVADG